MEQCFHHSLGEKDQWRSRHALRAMQDRDRVSERLDAEPDVNRRRRELLTGGERRVLPPAAWALFEALYAGRGHPLSGKG
jgi:hypothetical protein